MPKHFSPEADDQMPEKKTSQNRLLLLLLLLVALFAYLYFFTGLIKPREEQIAQAPAPEAAPADVVKQPLPPRPEAGGAQPGATAGEPAADAKGGEAPAQPETAPAKPGAPAAPAAAPEGAKAGKPAAAPEGAKAGKPAVAAKGEQGGKPAAAAKATPGKPAAPAADAKQAAGKPAPAKEAKTAAAARDAKSPAAAKEAKTAAAAKSAPGANGADKKKGAVDKKKAVPATAAGAYALEINDDLPQAEIKSVTAKLKQAGIAPVVTTKSQKREPVHRLYLADFGDRQEALEELERLKLAAPNAFMLKENGRYTVYAGSFMREGRAAVEQDRLYEKGVKLLLKTGTATVPVIKLRAGSFANQAKAEKAAQSLKQKGIAAKVVKVAK